MLTEDVLYRFIGDHKSEFRKGERNSYRVGLDEVRNHILMTLCHETGIIYIGNDDAIFHASMDEVVLEFHRKEEEERAREDNERIEAALENQCDFDKLIS